MIYWTARVSGVTTYDYYQKTKYCASRPSVSEHKLGEEGRYQGTLCLLFNEC